MKVTEWNPKAKRFNPNDYNAKMELGFIHATCAKERTEGLTIDFDQPSGRRVSINLSIEETLKLKAWIESQLKERV